MFEQLLYVLLAIIGLGILVFIHELGHFLCARREKMKIDVFSIGFGRPIYSWSRRGVRWQIGWLPFGGYVKIAGMQREGNSEPHEIARGFYSKRPMQRIRVALMGPLVNIGFALLIFSFLWLGGGRVKNFSDFTQHIGWVDPHSTLYQKGVRPGDVISSYDGHPFGGIKDLLIGAIVQDDVHHISGYKIDYGSGDHTNFDYTLKTYDNPNLPAQDHILTIGVLTPAHYLIYDYDERLFEAGSPMASSGIEPNDRIVWVDGEMIFSIDQLRSVINASTTFLTVKRGDAIIHTKIPRIRFDDLKTSSVQRSELDDWRYETGLSGNVRDLYFIPYLLSPRGQVEKQLEFVDVRDQERSFQHCQRCAYFHPLEENDQILAVDGIPVSSSYDLLRQLQERHVLTIVQRDPNLVRPVSWINEDQEFDRLLALNDLQKIVHSIGVDGSTAQAGHLILLHPAVPKPLIDIPLTRDLQEMRDRQITHMKKEIEAIRDPQKRLEQQKAFDIRQKSLVLGLVFKDRSVVYNPSPLKLFGEVLQDTWRTLVGLFSGSVNPKYVSGPIGIMGVIHHSWEVGIKEALYWMGVISLNLGIVNLLPIPILDGGHIFFSLYEAITRRRISGKTMDRLVVPFVALIIGFFLYITFHDVLRIFSRFF